jgi:HEAT repeat protein
MPTIRDELCRFIRLNEQEQMLQHPDALEQLGERFGDGVIPGLIECLEDGHPDIRRLAIGLLAAARPRSDAAVPALIKRLTDEDWLVQVAVMTLIGDFGSQAVGAIPHLEPWLESPNEYLRLLSAITIISLDPCRTEFLPQIWEAANSDHPVVQSLVREFFDDPLD